MGPELSAHTGVTDTSSPGAPDADEVMALNPVWAVAVGVTVNVRDTWAPTASVARIVKVDADPPEVGVPEMTPVAVFSVRPVGNDPDVIAYVTGATPPVTATDSE